MALSLQPRHDLRTPDWGVPQANMIDACLEGCEWADESGFERAIPSEHPRSEEYLPSPITMATAIAARANQIRISIAPLILLVHDGGRMQRRRLLSTRSVVGGWSCLLAPVMSPTGP